MRFIIKFIWVVAETALAILGLVGLPDDIAKFSKELEAAQPVLNDPAYQWWFLLGAALLFFGGIAYGGSTLTLPFRRKFRYWLNAVEQHDSTKLARCLPIAVRQIQIEQTKKGPMLLLNLGIFNGSVYTLKCIGVTGDPPQFRENNPEEKTTFPPLQTKGNLFHDLHHADKGELVLAIPLNEKLVEKIRSAADKIKISSGSNALLDFRNSVMVVVAKETGEKYIVPLLGVHMSEMRELGLEHYLGQITESE